MALVIGEFKACDATSLGRRVWIKHLPDAPLLIEAAQWARIERAFAALFEARDADSGLGVRLMMAALIHARREHTYEIDAASLMLTSEHWIPLEGVHELPLVHALIEQQRRFVKPLRYDAKSAAAFPNALLLDAGSTPVPLHVLSPFMDRREHAAKSLAWKTDGQLAWIWNTGEPMPRFPSVSRS